MSAFGIYWSFAFPLLTAECFVCLLLNRFTMQAASPRKRILMLCGIGAFVTLAFQFLILDYGFDSDWPGLAVTIFYVTALGFAVPAAGTLFGGSGKRRKIAPGAPAAACLLDALLSFALLVIASLIYILGNMALGYTPD